MCYNILMNKSATIHARIEPSVKDQAEKLLKKLGLSPTEAIRLFYHQICLRKAIPFQIEVPNKTTENTLRKSQKGEDIINFNSTEEMFSSWGK